MSQLAVLNMPRHLKGMGDLLLIMLAFTILSTGVGTSEAARCIERERQALLSFKHGLLDEDNFLSSWTSSNEDCCSWRGISCHNQTGHVIMLNLRQDEDQYFKEIEGEIGSSLLELKYLKHLDLSLNNFSRIPNFIGSFTSLNYLNLSYNTIMIGTTPSQLGNLTNLRVLDLRQSIQMIDSLHWLPHLSSLRILKFEYANFTRAVDWLKSIKLATSLSSLELSHCKFPKVDISFLSHLNSSNSLRDLSVSGDGIHPTMIPWLLNVSSNLVTLSLKDNYRIRELLPNSFANMESLERIDLSGNSLQGELPKSLGNLCNLKVLLLNYNEFNGTVDDLLANLSGCAKNSLEILDLSRNQLRGPIPDIETFSSLRELYLAENRLEGPFPFSLSQIHKLVVLHLYQNLLTRSLPDLSKLSFLRELRVDSNKLNGSLPKSIGQLTNLAILDVSSNYFTGIVSKSHLQKLFKLQLLDLSFNSLTFESDVNLPGPLSIIKLNSCKVGPRFPSWLQRQLNLSYLDISDAGIYDAIPEWFYHMTSNLRYLNLSSNRINGTLQDFPMGFGPFPTIDLSSNLFQGTIPVSLSNAVFINLSNNKFTRFRSFFCKLAYEAAFLDISYNMLTGSFPDCWLHCRELLILNLESNNLSGILSSSLYSLCNIQTLRLRSNNFSGTIPFLQNSPNLQFLDLGNNKLSGNIPAWIGQSLKYLEVLRLKSNKLNGSMPQGLCNLSSLTILDLCQNDISGKIPLCIQNLTSMASTKRQYAAVMGAFEFPFSFGYENSFEMSAADKALLMWKGTEHQYEKIPEQLRMIDLSCNALVGHIPKELTNLVELVQLNLSRNRLNGTIPEKIGQLRWLDSLDLSHNHLSEEIPSSLTNISFLGFLDLSYNQLSGRIPTGTQLQSFNASSYEENRGLCGPPLTSLCPGDETSQPPSQSAGGKSDSEDGGLWLDMLWFYIGIGIGFNFAFWGVCGTLLSNTSWRRAYFGFLSNLGDWLYVTVRIKWNKVRKGRLRN